jgi:hypothetical protein
VTPAMGLRSSLAVFAMALVVASCGRGDLGGIVANAPSGAVNTEELARALGACPEREKIRSGGGEVFVDYGPFEVVFEGIDRWLEVDPASAVAGMDKEATRDLETVTVRARPVPNAGPEGPDGFVPTQVLISPGPADVAPYRWAGDHGARVFVAVGSPADDDPAPPVLLTLVEPSGAPPVVVGECAYEDLWRFLRARLGEDTGRFLASVVGLPGPEIVARLAEATAARTATTTTLPPWRDLVLDPVETPRDLLERLNSVGLSVDVPDAWYGHGWALCAIVHPDGKVAGTGCVDLNESWLQPRSVCEGVGADGEPTGRCREIPPHDPSWVVYVPEDGRVELWVTDSADRPVQLVGEVVLPPEARRDGAFVSVALTGEMDPATGKVAGAGVRVLALR